MTSRKVMAGVKTYLVGAGLTLSGLSYTVAQDTEDKAFPLIIVEETGTEEHETLLGVYSMTVDVHLFTNPEGATDAEHETAMDEIYAALGDTSALQTALSAETNLTCYNVRGINQFTGPEDGRRKTTVTLQVIAKGI